jgi:Family of unknown function (DUF6492)
LINHCKSFFQIWAHFILSQQMQIFNDSAVSFKIPSTIQLVNELTLIPEFKLFRSLGGWYWQQLVKLAIANKIRGDFYLTLDSDVILTKSLRMSDVIQDNRSPCYREREGLHDKWYNNVEHVIGFPPLYRRHNVTPAILSKQGVNKLTEHLEKMAYKTRLGLLRKRDLILLAARTASKHTLFGSNFSAWRGYGIWSIPWTEYSLYYSFIEGTNQFDEYHFEVDRNHCLFSHNNSVWDNEAGGFES